MRYKLFIILNKVSKKLIIKHAQYPEVPLGVPLFITFPRFNMEIEYLQDVGLDVPHNFS